MPSNRLIGPKAMFELVNGKPKRVLAFEDELTARRYETAKRGVKGFIKYEDKIVAVKSSFDPQSKGYPGPWLHVFVKPLRGDKIIAKGFVKGVQTSTRNYQPPQSRSTLVGELLKKARYEVRDTERRHRRETRQALVKLRQAMSVAKGLSK